jgi:hypothetical protein
LARHKTPPWLVRCEQVPLSHTSEVQTLLSLLHAVPLVFVGFEHVPLPGWQVPA